MSQSTFNVIIATIAKPTLQHMLNSLQEQLEKDDCLTLLFDGLSEKDVTINTDIFKCKVIKYYHETRLGSYGHAIRNYYKTNFIKQILLCMPTMMMNIYPIPLINYVNYASIRIKCIFVK